MNKTLLKDVLLWFYWYPLRFFLQRIPARCAYTAARAAGLAYFHLSSKKRGLVEREFRELFNGAPHCADTGNAVKRAFAVFAQNEFEALLFSTLTPKNIDRFIRYEGMEHLDRALSQGRGALLLFAHFGANQMIMPAVGHKGYTMSQLSAPPTVWVEKLPDKKFSMMGKKALQLRWRQELSLPVRHINIFGSMRGAFETLKRNEVLGVAVDGGGGKNRVAVDFLGRKALFSTGALELAMRTGCKVLPTFMVRNGEGFHTMIVEHPLELSNRGEDIRNNIRLFIERLERYVLKYPCHYLMFLALRRFMADKGDTPFFVTEESVT